MSFILLGNYIKGDTYESTFTTFGGTVDGDDIRDNCKGVVKTQDMYGIGGGVIWEYDFGNKSMLRISGLYGYGATDFQEDIGNQISQVNDAWTNQFNRFQTGRSNNVQTTTRNGVTEPFVAVNPVNRATEALATIYWVWNPNPCFSLGAWANWEYNDNGTQALGF